MLIYSQSKGTLTDAATGKLLGQGYSGHGDGRNNPEMQGVARVGPIPRGFWHILPSYNSAKTGPLTYPLHKMDGEPSDDTDDCTGRSAFRIHGDNAKGDASEGCIIMPRVTREALAMLNHEILKVVS